MKWIRNRPFRSITNDTHWAQIESIKVTHTAHIPFVNVFPVQIPAVKLYSPKSVRQNRIPVHKKNPRNVQGHFRNYNLQNPRRAAGGRPGCCRSRPKRRRPYKGILLAPHPAVIFTTISTSTPASQGQNSRRPALKLPCR